MDTLGASHIKMKAKSSGASAGSVKASQDETEEEPLGYWVEDAMEWSRQINAFAAAEVNSLVLWFILVIYCFLILVIFFGTALMLNLVLLHRFVTISKILVNI